MRKIKFAGIVLVCLQFIFSNTLQAQLTSLPSGGNKKAAVSERIGITDITIQYSRPGVKGRDGKIWGTLIPAGYTDLGFGTTKQAPWRAGANENTIMEFSSDVKIDGHELPGGKYGFFIVYGANECTLIFSKNYSSWGSFYYDPKEDVLQVKVKPVATEKSVEWLKYEFLNETENSATIALLWEKLMIPFKVEVDYVKTQLESFRHELRSDKGFSWQPWTQAAEWCLQKNTNLDEALLWADSSTSINFGGEQSFHAWSVKAQILDKLNRGAESIEVMKKAMPYGSAIEIHQYARQLLAQKKDKEAFDIFKINYDKHPNVFTTNMGMARAYSAMGNYKKALEFAKKAQPQAPDPANKAVVDKMITTLQDGKDVN